MNLKNKQNDRIEALIPVEAKDINKLIGSFAVAFNTENAEFISWTTVKHNDEETQNNPGLLHKMMQDYLRVADTQLDMQIIGKHNGSKENVRQTLLKQDIQKLTRSTELVKLIGNKTFIQALFKDLSDK